MTQIYTYSLRKAQAEREHKRRENEIKRCDLLRYFNGHQALHHSCVFSEQSEATALRRQLKEYEQQQQLLDQLDKAEQQFKEKRATEEAMEAEACKEEAHQLAVEREQKQRQHIIQESSELKQLQSLIHEARIKVLRDDQIAAKEASNRSRAAEDQQFSRVSQALRVQEEQKEQLEVQQRRELARSAHKSLAVQLQYKQLMLEQEKDLLNSEKEAVNIAAEREEEEDRQEAELLVLKQQQERKFVEDYLKQRHMAKLNQAMDQAAEDARIEGYQRMITEREDKMASIAVAKQARLEMRYEKIKGKREEEMRLAQEQEDLLNLLRATEEAEHVKEAALQRKQQQQHMMRLMADANQQQIRFRAEQEALAKKEEEKFRQILLARFAEEDHIDQMNQQKRRLKLEEHKREVAKLIAQKKSLEQAAKDKERADQMAAQAEEEKKAAIIEAEKARLIAAAGPLQQFIPRSVLTNEKKLPSLQPAYLD